MNPVLRAVALVAPVALVALGGCSTPPPAEPDVATLETTGTAPTVTSTTPTASRPRERLDMRPEELDALYQAYDTCLAENGYDTGRGVGGGGGGSPIEAVVPDESKRVAAEAACVHLDPLPPWEYDVANPESGDFVHALVQCLRDKGVRYVEESSLDAGENRRGVSLGGPDNDSESISKGLELIPTCEKELTNR